MDFVPLKFIDPLSHFLYTYVLIYLLVGAGIYFTVRTKGVQFRYFGRMIKQIFNSPSDWPPAWVPAISPGWPSH